MIIPHWSYPILTPTWQASVLDLSRRTMLSSVVGVDRIELSPRVPKTRMRFTITPHPERLKAWCVSRDSNPEIP